MVIVKNFLKQVSMSKQADMELKPFRYGSVKAEKLPDGKLKLVLGGDDCGPTINGGTYSGKTCCYYTTEGGTEGCTSDPEEAEMNAGCKGDWGCNGATAKERCGNCEE